ncbi:NAD(P)/FAD-dependent oxidoreductase [Actinoplanes aureus]|uniref:FAD-dependent oxidoreductase n=1 Tax=Actinoplanes aureus TaxID=2792083 RepID=A0A931G0J1_9ACTN|nr:FAD-dependent oxidoreductase [Actinoplanes aureus]MBG0564121.1 FAD-dependent oxidoreductase [Actinoplanes aureus]
MKHRIVVLGAGYAGAHAAGRLARRLHPGDVEITLVNADPDFVERVRLHQVAAGQDLRHRPLADVYRGTSVTVRVSRVTAVDVGRRTVDLVDGEIGYDTLVYALGSTAAVHGVPGVAEHAYHLASRPAALRLRERLSELAEGASVLVAGGGLTAVEAATEIAESRPDLDVAIAARDGVGDWLSDKARRHLRDVLDRLGIRVHEHTGIVRVDEDGVATGGGERIPATVTVWAAGFTTHPIAAATALEVDGTGRIVVDATMRSVSHPDVYAVGDAAVAGGVGGKPLRMSCASGIPMGWQAADAIAARLTGRKVPAKPIPYVTQCISLGRRDGIVQLVTPDDRARSSAVTGRMAARIKEFVCAGAGWSIAHPTVLLPSRRRRVVPAGRSPLPTT